MKVEVLRLKKISSSSKFRAFADVLLGGLVEVKGCSVFEGPNGLFAALPSQKGKDEKYYPIVKINDEAARNDFNHAVVEAYNAQGSMGPSVAEQEAAASGDSEVPF